MKKLPMITTACAATAGLIISAGLSAHAQTVIFSDTFAGSAQNLDGAPTTGITGLDPALPRSASVESSINGSGQLLIQTPGGPGSGESGQVRFDTIGSTGTLYDWSAGSGGSAITAAGGMSVSFNWTANDTTSDNWLYFAAGADPADVYGYNYSLLALSASTDSGIIFANDGNVQAFNNGANTASGSFSPTSASHVVTLDYYFSSWAAGAPVTLDAYVDGNEVVTDSFSWVNGTTGAQYLDIGSYQESNLVGPFTITTVPEPGSWAMMAGGSAVLLAIRRFRRA